MEGVEESDRFAGAPHPREAARLVGHAAAEATLLDAVRAGRLAHAWLIGGPRGIGKATLAWRFARFLLAHPAALGAGERTPASLDVSADHPIAARLRSGAMGDIAVLRRQWNDKTKKFFSDIRVDDVRGALHLFQRAAGAGGFRICIIDSADDLNRSSANALLKAIEEPPPRSLFLIVAHRPAQVLPTILSRCRKLTLGALDDATIAAVLDGLPAEEPRPAGAGLAPVIARGGGSVGRTLRLLDPVRRGLDRELHAELDRLPAVDWRAVHRLADRMGPADGGEAIGMAVETTLDWIDARLHAWAAEGRPPARLAPLAEVWDKVLATAREADILNLDRRPMLLSIFADLAQAIRLAGPP